jgi:predicted transcriptional regulator of viral defense system
MDWATIIRQESLTSSILRADHLASKYKLSPVVVAQALARQERRGLVEHISRKVYFNFLASGGSPRELVNIMRPDSYVSLETALREHGISTQSPSAVTCVTTGWPGQFGGGSIRLSYRSISKHLYWGFETKKTRYGSYNIAEPEKAVLDFIYLALQQGVEPPIDELDLSRLNYEKLLRDSAIFPTTVRNCLVSAIAAS